MSRYGRRQLHELYYHLKLTRRVEEELARLHREEKVAGPFYLAAGREAVSVGAAHPLKSTDWLCSSLPSVGCLLVRGVPPSAVVAHFMGKDTGSARGRDGSVRVGDRQRGLVAPGPHLATHVGVMAGVALAAKYRDLRMVAVAVVGDRAITTGDFHEGLNIAAVHQLPLVVVVEVVETGSRVRVGSPPKRRYLYEQIRGYGVPSLPADGGDILQVLQVTETAVERARSGKGPTLVEARTWQGAAHAPHEEAPPAPFARGSVDDGSEVPADRDGVEASREEPSGERQGDRANDPVESFEAFLVDHGLLQPVELELITDRVERIVEDAVRSAEADPLPDASTVAEGVFAAEPQRSVGSSE